MPSFAYQVSLSVGQQAVQQASGDPADPAGQFAIASLPALDLTPGCRIEVGTYHLDGTPRTGDATGDVTMYVDAAVSTDAG